MRKLSSFAVLVGLGLAAGCGDDGAGTGGSGPQAASSGASGGGEPAATTSTGGTGGAGSGASTSASTGTGECDGVIEDGVCVGKCTPDQCTEGNTCVGNRCSLLCDAHSDCYPGTACSGATEDDTGAAIQVCTLSLKSPILGASCPFGDECDGSTVCPDGTPCGDSLCGGEACADGVCPDGTACAVQSCDAAACRSPRCIDGAEVENAPSGEAYCTQDDCVEDADCAPAMVCARTAVPNEICGREGELELGDPDLPCLAPADFTTDGKTYQEGPVSVLRNTCVVREQCSPCVSDLDCSGVAGQLCAAIGGEGRCATTCLGDADCESDAACLDDPDHPGTSVCTPRYGACTGEAEEFCAPCQDDLDCGGPDTSFHCVDLAGAQRGCLDLSFPDTCVVDEDCPLAPDGTTHGECLDEAEGVGPDNTDYYQRCYLPFVVETNRFVCW